MPTGIQLQPPPRRQRDDYDRREQLAQAMMMQATDASPKGHWLAAVAQALQGYMGGRNMRQAQNDRQDAATQQVKSQNSERDALIGALTGQFRDPKAPAAHEVPIPGAFGTSPMQELPQMDNRPQMPGFAQALLNSGSPGAQNLAIQQLATQLMGGGESEFRTAAPGTFILDRHGNPVRQLPERQSNGRNFTTAAPGTYILDQEGNPVRQLPERPQQPTERTTERQREVASLVEQGVPQARAERIAYGHERIEIVPQTGLARIINVADNTVREIPITALSDGERSVAVEVGGEGGAVEQTGNIAEVIGLPEGVTLYDMADIATGPMSALAAFTAVPRAWAGMDRSGRVTRARQTFSLAQRELMRGLVNNPRFPVAEMNAVLQEIGIDPRVWDDGDVMRDRMGGLDQMLRTRMALAERDAADPSLPQDLRSAQNQNARLIRNFLPILGVPQGPRRDAPAQSPSSDIQDLLNRYAPQGGGNG